MIIARRGRTDFDEAESFQVHRSIQLLSMLVECSMNEAMFRYLGSSEAAYLTLEFPITEQYPAVQALPVHLQDQQEVRKIVYAI